MSVLGSEFRFQSLCALALVALVAGTSCGGSGGGVLDLDPDPDGGGSGGTGGGGGGGGSGGSGGEDTLLLYGGSLTGLDPADTANPLLIDDEITLSVAAAALAVALDGSFDASDTSLNGVRVGRIVYSKNDSVYAADLAIQRDSGGKAIAPIPQLLASFGAPVTRIELERDYSASAPVNYYVVETAGSWEIFSDADLTPTPFPGVPVTALFDPSNATFQGWLTHESGNLIRVATDLSTTTIAPAATAQELGRASDGSEYLALDDTLYNYNPQTDTLTNLNLDLSQAAFEEVEIAGSELYIARSNFLSFEVWRATPTGTPELIVTDSNSVAGNASFTLLNTRLAYITRSNITGNSVLKSVRLDGTDPLVLRDSPAEIFFAYEGLSQLGDRIFYNVDDADAYAVQADGTGEVKRDDARWLIPQFKDKLVLGEAPAVQYMFLISKTAGDMQSLDVVDPNTPDQTLRNLGELPAGLSFQAAVSFQDAKLATAFGGAGLADVYFFDASEAGSLIQITDTPAVEIAIF